MASLYRGGKRAGASKRTLAQRKKDNAGVKGGTLRKGKGGKLNVYDAKTGTWKRAVKTSAVKKRAAAVKKSPAKKTAVSATERRRDAAMASRRTSTASTRSAPVVQQMTAAQRAEWEKNRGGVSAPGTPKIGATRTIYRSGKQIKQTYSVKGWVDRGTQKSAGQWGGIGR